MAKRPRRPKPPGPSKLPKTPRPRRPPFNKYPADGVVGAIKYRFANHLMQLMNDRGWNESELARRMEALRPPHPKQRDIGRDLVCHWVCAKHMPTSQNMALLAKAFGLPMSEVLPEGLMMGESTPVPLLLRTLPDGRIDLQVDMRVAFKTFGLVSRFLQVGHGPVKQHVEVWAESVGDDRYRLRIKEIVPPEVAFMVEKLLRGDKNA